MSMEPRPNCPGCGASSSVYHWAWCRLEPEDRNLHCVLVREVEKRNEMRAAQHEAERLLGMEVG